MYGKCIQCGGNILVVDTKKFPKTFCSYSCYEQWCRFNKKPNCKCTVCGKPMHMKPSRIKRAKNGVTCSIECANILKSGYMQGENNHQFGLKGELNASFKGAEITKVNHNQVDILVYAPKHPFRRSDDRVKKHRLVVEENYEYFNPIYFIKIGGKMYLKPEVDVHHRNGNHNDNSIENLEPLTRGEHTTEHNLEKEIIRDNLGRIIGVVKSGNIGEGCSLSCETKCIVNPEISNIIS